MSGRQVLAQIDRTLQQIREDLQGMEDRVSLSAEQLVELRQHESSIYRKLAELRIDDFQSGSFLQDLDAAEHQAAKLLVERKQAQAELMQKIEASRLTLNELEAARQSQVEQLHKASETMQQQIDVTYASLQKTEAYQTQQAKTQKAVDTLAAAEKKVKQAEQDQNTKGQPFRDDSLFAYLWKKHYGTAEYKANFIARFFDQMLARHIRFESARQNYFMLEEIPRRLLDHSKGLQKKLNEEMAALSELEKQAEKADGVPALEAVVDEEKQRLVALDADINQQEEVFAGLIDEEEIYISGKDDYFRQAISVLVNNFRAEPIPELRREAELTYGYEDDSLVSQLGQLRSRKASLDQGMQDNSQVHQQYKKRLRDMEDIRRSFKQYDYDASNSRFNDPQSLEILLREFRRGAYQC